MALRWFRAPQGVDKFYKGRTGRELISQEDPASAGHYPGDTEGPGSSPIWLAVLVPVLTKEVDPAPLLGSPESSRAEGSTGEGEALS